jgi:anoctamin-10
MLTIQIAKTEAAEQFKKLIRALANAGLQTEVRKGDESSLLVFVKAADEKIFGDMVYRSRSDTQG